MWSVHYVFGAHKSHCHLSLAHYKVMNIWVQSSICITSVLSSLFFFFFYISCASKNYQQLIWFKGHSTNMYIAMEEESCFYFVCFFFRLHRSLTRFFLVCNRYTCVIVDQCWIYCWCCYCKTNKYSEKKN